MRLPGEFSGKIRRRGDQKIAAENMTCRSGIGDNSDERAEDLEVVGGPKTAKSFWSGPSNGLNSYESSYSLDNGTEH
jgi:hypothetical protein